MLESYNNKIIRNILFKNVKSIAFCGCNSHYSWSNLIRNPILLVRYNYIDVLLNQYFNLEENLLTDLQQRYKFVTSVFEAERSIRVFLEEAVQFNRITVLRYLFDERNLRLRSFNMNDCRWTDIAARHGHFEMVKFIYQHPLLSGYCSKVNDSTFYEAAKTNNVELIEWLSKNINITKNPILHFVSMESMSPIECASSHGNFDMVKWLVVNRPKDKRLKTVEFSLAINRLDIIEWLDSNGYIDHAKIEIDLDRVLPTLNEHSIEWLTNPTVDFKVRLSSQSFAIAVSSGRLNIAKWINEKHKEYVKVVPLLDVVGSYHLETIQWLHHNKFLYSDNPIGELLIPDKDTPEAQPFEMIKWIHENRSEKFSLATMRSAACFSLDIVKYLHNNVGMKSDLSYAIENAARYQQLDIVKFLHENTSQTIRPNRFHNIIGSAGLEVVKFIHSNRSERQYWTPRVMDKAAKHNHLDAIKFMNENRTERCTQQAIVYSIYFGHNDITQYLLDHKLCEYDHYVTFKHEGGINFQYETSTFNNNYDFLDNSEDFVIELEDDDDDDDDYSSSESSFD
ncbi:hypothetical protein PPL_01551 [Heterostelium album PN500]|uniref:Ankyrin repeat-containing protein n=1 Tax=Heterostelium pallidum (strain ATCC 26659 / Pp 5 / PN500) TaxID=670386 RepID=D3AZT8_HETP5|nr:hypothetical protein PPL_01551 [Heterostelium album PN500]EFA84562.1 hypothetical protein PPL_01551 [Heterostelium album PN500]|eukprot:XP_020436675.1 hypothetical protein PPL_01551 [Heterostelium album PN500]